MIYKTLSLSEANSIISQYDSMGDNDFEELTSRWKRFDVDVPDPAYTLFRNELVKTFSDALSESGGKLSYLLDLRVGLKLYQLMPISTDFTLISANNDDIWRFLSVKVMPDITYLRYPDPAKGDVRINSKRFYRGTRRIWLKTLWWYVYLSWQGTESQTYEVLKNNATDNINKLIETPGKGYRLNLYRNIVREYYETAPHKAKDFAAITKLNNVKCLSVEPSLVIGGEAAYAKQLVYDVKNGGI